MAPNAMNDGSNLKKKNLIGACYVPTLDQIGGYWQIEIKSRQVQNSFEQQRGSL
jgi:hypothetical protein